MLSVSIWPLWVNWVEGMISENKFLYSLQNTNQEYKSKNENGAVCSFYPLTTSFLKVKESNIVLFKIYFNLSIKIE